MRLGIGLAGHLLHAEEGLAGRQAGGAGQWEDQIRQRRGDGLVALGDAPLAKQRLVAATARRIGGEQHQPGGVPVDAVQRHQVRIAQTAHQARLQGLLNVLAGRHHRQEVRLVGHHQVLVDVQHAFLEGNRRLVGHLAEVLYAQAFPVGMRGTEGPPLAIQHPAAGHARQPGVPVDGRKARAQAVEHRGPVAGGQVEDAGTNRRRVGHAGAFHQAKTGSFWSPSPCSWLPAPPPETLSRSPRPSPGPPTPATSTS